MNIRIILAIMYAISFSPAFGESFNTQNEKLLDVQKHPEKWQEEVAFSGIIKEASESNNTPYLKVEIGKNSNRYLWVAVLFSPEGGNNFKIGNTLSFLGYYTALEKHEKRIVNNNTGYHLLAFCVVNITYDEKYYVPQAIKQCEEWEAGTLPKSKQ